MTSINVDREIKAEFDKLQPDGDTQKEFVRKLLECWDANNGRGYPADVDAMVEQVTKQTASEVELAARRGVTHALEEKL